MKPSGCASCRWQAALHILRQEPQNASYGAAVLHKPPFQTWHGVAKRRRLKHCFRLHFITPRQAISFRYEALRLRSVWPVIHSTSCDGWWENENEIFPFAIQRYPHYIMTCNPVLYGWIFLYPAFTQWMTGTYSVNSPKHRTNRERQILSKSVCFE